MSICNKLSADVLLNCDYPGVGGAEEQLILYNKDDVASYSVDAQNPLIIDGITMKTGTEAYKFEGQRSSNNPGFEFVEAETTTGFTHNVNFTLITVDPTVKLQIKALKDARLVAIVKNNYRGADGKGTYEIYGKEIGLLASEMTRQLNEGNGRVNITLSTEDGYMEPNPPHSYFNTSLATSDADIDALLTASS